MAFGRLAGSSRRFFCRFDVRRDREWEPDTDPEDGNSTLVTFRIRVSGNGSLLTVTRDGFTTLDGRFGEATDNAAIELEGWNGGLTTLAAHLGEEPR